MGFWDFLADRQTLILRIERLEDRLKNRNAMIDRSQDLAARERELAEARGLILSLQEDNRKLEEQGQDFAQETVEGRLRIEELEGQVATLNDELSDVMRQRDEECAHRQQLQRELNSRVVDELVSTTPAPAPTKRGGRRKAKTIESENGE